VNNNIKKYLDYKNMFKVKKSKSILLFEKLLYDSDDINLECSNKIKGTQIYSSRLNIWYHKDILDNLNRVFYFFREIQNLDNVNLNYNLLNQIISKFNYRKISDLICGIDYRPNLKESRVKIWFIITDYPKKIEEILNLYKNKNVVIKFIHSNELLFGIDLNFNGKTMLKIYPVYTKNKLKENNIINQLSKLISKKAFSLMNKCKKIHISFTNYSDRIIHFYPENPDEFLSIIKNENVNSINKKYNENGYSLQVVSLLERELVDNNLTEINLYY